MNKKRVITNYRKISDTLKKEIANAYPFGFTKFLTSIKDLTGEYKKALYLETGQTIYLIKFTAAELARLEMTNIDYLSDDDSYVEDTDYLSDLTQFQDENSDDISIN